MSTKTSKKLHISTNQSDLVAFSKRLEVSALEAGQNPVTIAAALKVSRQTVDHWFRGRNRPKAPALKKLADLLGVATVWLARGTGINPSGPTPGPGSTISPRPIASYEQPEEHMGAPRLKAVEAEGLHSHTEHIEIGGQKIAVSTFSPDPGWIHRAIDDILASDDQSVVLALESNVRVFLDKVTKEKKLEQRIDKLEAELRREKNSHVSSSESEREAGNFD